MVDTTKKLMMTPSGGAGTGGVKQAGVMAKKGGKVLLYTHPLIYPPSNIPTHPHIYSPSYIPTL